MTDTGRFTHKVVTRPAVSLAQDMKSSPARTGGLTTMLSHLSPKLFGSMQIPGRAMVKVGRAPGPPTFCLYERPVKSETLLGFSQLKMNPLPMWLFM